MDHLAELEEVADKLAQAHRELGELTAAQKEGAVRAWWADDSTSVTARERASEYQTLDLTVEILHLKGEIAALTVEWETLKILVDAESRAETRRGAS